MKTKNILVPMDFTAVSVNALTFALNCYPESHIHVLHIRQHSLGTGEPPPIGAYETNLTYWKEAITLFIQREMNWSIVPDRVTIETDYRSIVNGILAGAEENDCQIVVMGTRDKYNFFEELVGTTSLGVVKKSPIPVYLVPKYAKYKSFKHVVVASDYHLKDRDVVQVISSWNSDFEAFICFLHVENSRQPESYEAETNVILEALFADANLQQGFEVRVLHDQDVSQSLLGTAYNDGADLMILLPQKQNLLSSLLFKSVSKKLILKAEIPLLFFPS